MASRLPPQFDENLELLAEPEAVLGLRQGLASSVHGLEVLIRWKGIPLFEATWEPHELIQQQFPTFPLRTR